MSLGYLLASIGVSSPIVVFDDSLNDSLKLGCGGSTTGVLSR